MTQPTQYPLRQMRLAAGMTIRELEVQTGINRGRLSILERGVVPTDDEAAKILRALAAGLAVYAPAVDRTGVIGSADPEKVA
jgi:transcriptional regulator with XRE-family HTH domain